MDAKEAYRCGKCGLCLQTCPVYKQLRDETLSPRAKVQLIKQYGERNLPVSAHLDDIISCCLMCGSCTAGCPSGVSHKPLYMRTRTHMAKAHGQDWKKRVLFHLLVHEDQLRLAAKFAKLGRNQVLEHLETDIRIGNLKLKQLPKFNARPFRDRLPERIDPIGPLRGTLLYFTGCSTQYLYEETGHAVIRLLRHMGFRIIIPKEAVCCGFPLFVKGLMAEAKSNILKNIDLFSRWDIQGIITDCATCGSALTEFYPAVLEELGVDPAKAAEMAGKVKDISQFLMNNFNLLLPHLDPQAEALPVTYHSPCHMRNSMGVESAVEKLLDCLPNARYIRSHNFDTCCGGGGTFFYDYPEISKKIAKDKIAGAKATGAQFWATGCPGCRIQLSGSLEKKDKIALCHPAELAEKALKNRPNLAGLF